MRRAGCITALLAMTVSFARASGPPDVGYISEAMWVNTMDGVQAEADYAQYLQDGDAPACEIVPYWIIVKQFDPIRSREIAGATAECFPTEDVQDLRVRLQYYKTTIPRGWETIAEEHCSLPPAAGSGLAVLSCEPVNYEFARNDSRLNKVHRVEICVVGVRCIYPPATYVVNLDDP